MPNITQFPRNIISTFNKIYFLQTITHRIPNEPQPHAFSGKKMWHVAGRPTNQHTKDLRAETCASKRPSGGFSQSCVLHIAGISNALYYNWDFAYAKDFLVAVGDMDSKIEFIY